MHQTSITHSHISFAHFTIYNLKSLIHNMSNPGSRSHGPSTMFYIIILSREQYCLCLFRSGPIYIPLLLLLFHFIYIFRQQHFAAVQFQFLGLWCSPSMVMIIIVFRFQDFSFYFFFSGSRFFLFPDGTARALFFNGKSRNVSTHPLFSPNKYTFTIIRMFWIWIVSHFSFY